MVIGETLLRLPTVLELRGVGRSTHYKDVGAGLFTRPVSLGPRLKAWPASEVNAMNSAIVAGKDESHIRALVKKLEAKRTHGADEAAQA
jgi:prophage regulatory protein